MVRYTAKGVITGAIHDSLSDWKSEYKIQEDLPAIAEIIADEVLENLKQNNYHIVGNEPIYELQTFINADEE